MIFDPLYLVMVLPAVILAAGAQLYVRSTFARYSQAPVASRRSGAEVARRLLDANGLSDVGLEQVGGELSDHYDPRARVLRLSEAVAQGRSLASVGVAAHETGHALQHARGYGALAFRNGLVPLANLGSQLALPMILFGMFFRFSGLIWAGILFFSGAVLFQLVTLPVELNASRRAVAELAERGEIVAGEEGGVRSVLRAAAMTYLAAALVAVLQLLYFVSLGRSRD